ncbi:HK97 gp10 family phage protein [Castellaniella ginsengisoli]|uniref:HK97 gp10 family phage protein n=1 Tax=Castellaniella ginsengisoli TaxID=546114 RepID=A0AB39ENX7_9BURK
MVNSGLKMDFQQVFDRLDGLAGAAKEHLPRSMAVATGQVFRDEAKARAPRGDDTPTSKVGPRLPLAESIYLAYSESRSVPEAGIATYSVSWNSKRAPHGHLVEFGHWQPYRVYQDKDGRWWTDKGSPLSAPKWISAKPFLRPAYDATGQTAIQSGLNRGRERMNEILANPSILDQYK